jgi:hypothetical protein
MAPSLPPWIAINRPYSLKYVPCFGNWYRGEVSHSSCDGLKVARLHHVQGIMRLATSVLPDQLPNS